MLGKVEICGVNTAKLPTLKSDEMTELLRRSHSGDERARETLIQGNLRLVLSVIQRFASRGENAGRPLSGRLRGPHQGHRQFRRLAERPLLRPTACP